MSSTRLRVLSLFLLPIVLCAIATTLITAHVMSTNLEARTTRFGNAIADQLAITVADPVVQQDILSLNVLLNDLTGRGNFAFASVYDTSNRLLAQAGKDNKGLTMFTRDIVFQDAAAGYLQLGIERSFTASPLSMTITSIIIVYGIVIAIVSALGWFYGDLLYLWATSTGRAATMTRNAEPEDLDAATDTEPTISHEVTMLVVKVRPARHLHAYMDAIMAALALHRGQVELAGDDLIVTFRGREQAFQAICSAALVRKLMARIKSSILVKCGMHTAPGSDGLAGARKQATHLASLSGGELLASRNVYVRCQNTTHLLLTEFHSALTPDGEVYYLESQSADNEELLESQARQILK